MGADYLQEKRKTCNLDEGQKEISRLPWKFKKCMKFMKYRQKPEQRVRPSAHIHAVLVGKERKGLRI